MKNNASDILNYLPLQTRLIAMRKAEIVKMLKRCPKETDNTIAKKLKEKLPELFTHSPLDSVRRSVTQLRNEVLNNPSARSQKSKTLEEIARQIVKKYPDDTIITNAQRMQLKTGHSLSYCRLIISDVWRFGKKL